MSSVSLRLIAATCLALVSMLWSVCHRSLLVSGAVCCLSFFGGRSSCGLALRRVRCEQNHRACQGTVRLEAICRTCSSDAHPSRRQID